MSKARPLTTAVWSREGVSAADHSVRESRPYATCELTASVVLHAIVALNELSDTVWTSRISIGGAATVAGSGAISGADPWDDPGFSANVRGLVLNGTTVSPFGLGRLMEAEPAATPEVAVASACFSGVRPTCACAGR